MVKPIKRGIALILTALVLLVVTSMMFMAAGPKPIPWVKPIIEKAMSGKNTPYKVTIGEAVIDWRSLARIGTVRLSRVEWQSLDGQVFATLPELDASLSLPRLLIGHASLKTVTLNKPRLFLVRDEEGTVRLGLEENRALLPLEQLLAPLLINDEDEELDDSKMVRLPFKRFAIEDAYMQMKDVTTNATLVSSPFSIRVGRDYAGAYGAISMPFVLKEKKTKKATEHYVDGSAQWNRTTGESTAHLQFDKMPGYLACMFASCGPVKNVAGEFSGKISLGLGKNFKMKDVDIVINTTNAKIDVPDYFALPLDIKKGHISGRITDRAKQWVLSEANLKFKEMNFTANGNAIKRSDGWATQINAKIDAIPMASVHKYWPIMLAPESRKWVTTHIVEGRARNATLAVTLQPEDFKKDIFPDHFLKSEIDAENISIDYLPGFPIIKNANGHVTFTGITMDARTTSGTILTGTNITSARVFVPDLNATGTPMEADIALTAPARDVATLLALEHFPFEDALKLDPETLTGDVQGNLKLAFDAFSGKPDGAINFDKVTYEIDGLLKGVKQKKLWGKLDLQALDGTLKASNDSFAFNGTTTIDDTNLKLAAAQETGESMKVKVNGTLGHKEFAGVGLPELSEVKGGKATIDAELEVHGDDTAVTRADIDLTHLELDLPQITWKKQKGVKGSLSVRHLPKHAYAPHAYSVRVRADDLRAEGEIATKDDDVAYVSIPKLETNLNDFAVTYEHQKDGDKIVLKGDRLDASGTYGQKENSLLQDFPALDLTVNLREFVLSQTAPAKNVKGRLVCDKLRCTSANFTGITGKSNFTASIAQEAGKRRFKLNAGDAGDFLKAMDITDRVFNGALNLEGEYDDTQTPAPLTSRFIIEKFNLKNSQVLGKILSVGSFSGLANTLSGEGIYFDKLAATMIALGGKITVKDGKASGSAIGLTIEGALDTATTALNMKGVIVPANWINGFVGKIPIIGALAGGSGEGLVAFRYTVDGKYSDPDVSVNPLSGFTPGFLRNIFSIFDAPPPDELKDVQPEDFPSAKKKR